jgi:hypothetical protein
MPKLTRRALLAAALGALPGLAGCSLPWQEPSAPPMATPTPRPTPIATATPASIAGPQRIATPIAAPSRPPSRTPVPALRGAGDVLYVDNAGGGVILAEADGSRRRVLVPGEYGQVVLAPDGRRFAATNPPNSPATRIDLFDDDGRAFQRAALAGRLVDRLRWSRDSGRVLVSVGVALEEDPRGRGLRHWIISRGEGRSSGQDGVVELDLAHFQQPLDWSATGRLAVHVRQSRDDTTGALWTVGANGDDPRRVSADRLWYGDWSPDGQILYARGDFSAAFHSEGRRYELPTALFALDTARGLIRRIVGLREVAAQLASIGAILPTPLHWLQTVAVAPNGGYLALWYALEPEPRARSSAPTRFALVVVDDAGRLLWWDRASAPPAHFIFPAWSPHSRYLAYGYSDKATMVALRAIEMLGGAEFTVNLAALDTPQWSRDGRWLAAVTPQGIEIVATEPLGRTYPLATRGQSPVWRPR